MTGVDRRRLLRRLLATAGAGLPMLRAGRVDAAPQPVRRRLRFVLVFRNPLSRALEKQLFWSYLPADSPGTQRMLDVQVSAPHQVRRDPLGHRVLELAFDDFPPLAQKIVTVTAEVELYDAPKPELLSDPTRWLGAERFIESDDPRIVALAGVLQRSSPMGTARAIYDWTQRNLRYAGYVVEDLGALHALLEKDGDCTEYADLVVALARANGIPARMVGGYVVDRDAAPRPEEYHNWGELYVDGAWRLVDAQKENWLAPVDQYVAFRYSHDDVVNPVGVAHRYRIRGELIVAY